MSKRQSLFSSQNNTVLVNTSFTFFRLSVLAVSLFTVSSCSKYTDVAPRTPADKVVADDVRTGKELTPAQINRGAIPTQTDLEQLGNQLAFYLMNTTGYAAVISYNGAFKVARYGGFARMSQDAPSRAMTIFDRFSIASVAKTISAAALMKAISLKPQGSALLNNPAWTYLPKHWKYAQSSKQITLMQLLQHTSGIRSNGGSDYALLKQIMETGVQAMNVNVYQYDNVNYGMMRLIIPAIAGYNIEQINSTNGMTSLMVEWFEGAQAAKYADAYKDYCRKNIFERLGSCAGQVIDCKNTYDDYPGLHYRSTPAGEKGVVPGDLTLVSASQGWVLNTFQVDEFFRKLAFTNTLIPQSYHAIMVNNTAGYDVRSQTSDGVSYYWKNGIYNSSSNATTNQGYRSLIIGFGDGVQITIMANSPINLQNMAVQAHQDWVR